MEEGARQQPVGWEVGGRPQLGLLLDEDTKQRLKEEMATGEITTLPTTPEDGGSGGFPPGSFKDPKRLYCKNGGFFLRIKSDGGVDGIRERSDPHSESRATHTRTLQLLILNCMANHTQTKANERNGCEL